MSYVFVPGPNNQMTQGQLVIGSFDRYI